MRFMTVITMDESMTFGPPPPALFEALDEFANKLRAEGTLLAEGALLPSATGSLMHVADGKISVIDGPFTEAKEIIGGYAVHELNSKDEAIERSRQFLELHIQHLPGWKGTCEVRQMVDEDIDPATLFS